MTSANLTREETADRAQAITVRSCRVELDLGDAPDHDQSGFTVTTTIEFDATAEETWLDFLGVSVDSVTVGGNPVAVDYDGARIALSGLGERNLVTVTATGEYSRSGEGLHRFLDPVDGSTYLYTQYEPADARRVFACFEQPDLKAPFTFVVTAPAGWVVRSNAEPAERVERDGRTITAFEPTLPISTYLTAVVAGPYHLVESSWDRQGSGEIPLAALCRASLARHLDAEAIFEVTRAGLDFYAEHFDYPYPFGKYDQVFVPEYNLGAMENPGCVTFTESYVFRGAATRAQYEGRASTILHEMAHMWFGDLVTMRWWDDLWLKESFADFMGTLATAEATEFSDAWVAFANRRKAWAYQQDQLPTTHPIVADIVDLEAAKLNFDGITYAKGASVLRQLVAYVGRDAFFEGARRYFRAHAFGNTTLADLLTELSATSGRDLTSWAHAWLQTSGVSTVWLERTDNGYVIEQDPPRPHRLALGRYDFDDEGALVLCERVELDISAWRTEVDVAPAPLLLLNDGDLTYAKVRLDEPSLTTVRSSLGRIRDPLTRGLVWSALWNATRDGLLPAEQYVDLVIEHTVVEDNSALLSAALGNAQFAVERYLPRERRDEARARWRDATEAMTAQTSAGSDAQLAWARAFAAAAVFDDGSWRRIRTMLGADPGTGERPLGSDGLALDADLRWSFWFALAATGHADDDDLDRELARDDTAAGRTARLRAASAFPDAATKARDFAAALEDRSLTNDHLDAVIGGFRAGGRRDLTGRYDSDYFAGLEQVWRSRSIEIARRIVLGLFPSAESTAEVDDWLTRHPQSPAALRRLVIEQRDHLARELRVRGEA